MSESSCRQKMVPTPASASLYAQSHELDVLDEVACVKLSTPKGQSCASGSLPDEHLSTSAVV